MVTNIILLVDMWVKEKYMFQSHVFKLQRMKMLNFILQWVKIHMRAITFLVFMVIKVYIINMPKTIILNLQLSIRIEIMEVKILR